MPLDAGLQGREARGPRREIGVHVLQGVDSGPFDDVEHGVAEEGVPERAGARELRDDGAAHGVAHEDDGRELGPLHLLLREPEGGEQVVREGLEAQVRGFPLGDHARAVAPGVDGEYAGRREALADLVPHDGEREPRGPAAVVHHEEGPLADGGGEVGVDLGALGGSVVLEEQLPLEISSPWDGLKRAAPRNTTGQLA